MLGINDSILSNPGRPAYVYQIPAELLAHRERIFSGWDVRSGIDQKTKDLCETLDFDTWQYDFDQWARLIYYFFERLGFIERFAIPSDKLQNFITCCALSYRDNPYHNFRHACTVTQMIFIFLTSLGKNVLSCFKEIIIIVLIWLWL